MIPINLSVVNLWLDKLNPYLFRMKTPQSHFPLWIRLVTPALGNPQRSIFQYFSIFQYSLIGTLNYSWGSEVKTKKVWNLRINSLINHLLVCGYLLCIEEFVAWGLLRGKSIRSIKMRQKIQANIENQRKWENAQENEDRQQVVSKPYISATLTTLNKQQCM